MNIEKLRQRLSIEQLRFAQMYIAQAQTLAEKRVTLSELYQEAFKSKAGTLSCNVNSSKLLAPGSPTREYINAVFNAQMPDTLRTAAETMRDLELMATADITEIVSWKVEVINDREVLCPRVMSVDDLPKQVRRLIKSVTYTKNGPKLELHDQLRAQDMLNKMQGVYIEKREISGPNGGPITAAVAEVDKSELQAICKGLLNDI